MDTAKIWRFFNVKNNGHVLSYIRKIKIFKRWLYSKWAYFLPVIQPNFVATAWMIAKKAYKNFKQFLNSGRLPSWIIEI